MATRAGGRIWKFARRANSAVLRPDLAVSRQGESIELRYAYPGIPGGSRVQYRPFLDTGLLPSSPGGEATAKANEIGAASFLIGSVTAVVRMVTVARKVK